MFLSDYGVYLLPLTLTPAAYDEWRVDEGRVSEAHVGEARVGAAPARTSVRRWRPPLASLEHASLRRGRGRWLPRWALPFSIFSFSFVVFVDQSLTVPPRDCIQKTNLVRFCSARVPSSSGGGRTLSMMDAGICSKQNGFSLINAFLVQSVPLLSWCLHLPVFSKVPLLFRG